MEINSLFLCTDTDHNPFPWPLWRRSIIGWVMPPMAISPTSWKGFHITWCLCSSTLCTSKVNHWISWSPETGEKNMQMELSFKLLMLCSRSLCSSGEWQTRFDSQATSKGVFYLDNQNSVSVDMMKSSQYPLRLMDDPQLKAQVTATGTLEMLQISSTILSIAKKP